MPNSSASTYPPTVIEIRCSCRNDFNIRTQQASMTRQCHTCLSSYRVELNLAGTVKVFRTPPRSFIEQPFENYSNVTRGE